MRKFRWKDLATLPFVLCVGFLILLGKLCRLTYEQISVVFNLWLQGAVLTLSAILPAVMSILLLCRGFSVLRLLLVFFLVLYAILHIWAFFWMLSHYHLPFDRAFYLCVKELQELARRWHTTYQMVNLLIFVFAFLLLLALNIGLSYWIYTIL